MNKARIGTATVLAAAAVTALASCSSSGGSGGGSSNNNNTPSATPSATPAAGQNVTITPSTGLTDGQKVQVVGTGYTPGKTFGVTECADKGAATGAGDCNLRSIKTGVADASGKVTVTFTVAKGPFGSNNIVCSASQACIVSVADAGSAAPTEVAAAPIKFS